MPRSNAEGVQELSSLQFIDGVLYFLFGRSAVYTIFRLKDFLAMS